MMGRGRAWGIYDQRGSGTCGSDPYMYGDACVVDRSTLQALQQLPQCKVLQLILLSLLYMSSILGPVEERGF